MEKTTRIRTMGLLGIAGGLVWIIAFLVQAALAPTSGPLGLIAGALFPLALMGVVATTLGLIWAGAVAGSQFGKFAIGMFLVGQIVLVSGILLATGTDGSDSPLIGIGGVLSNVGALFTGIAIVTAGRWQGWQRFTPLVQGGYGFFIAFLPSVVTNQDPPWQTIAGWGLTSVLVGIALVTRARAEERRTAVSKNQMLKRGVIAMLAPAILVGIAGSVALTGCATPAQVSQAAPFAANSLGQPAGEIPLDAAKASDYFQRHPEVVKPGNALDMSDYYQRHSGYTGASAAVSSDWFERHLESLKPANAVDLSDWYLRHPESQN